MVLATLLWAASAIQGHAQDMIALQPGEAYLTRFSGTTSEGGTTVIDMDGTVGSIVDIRNPAEAPQGQQWTGTPQRQPVTAAEVGQVFGVALDGESPPNIYLTATSAFGLHRNAGNSDWIAGQWGPGGGPGTVYKLNAANRYQPEIFANITLDGRTNTGAALGNIAFDRWNRQFYVSDLETGVIHRLRASDGFHLGQFDHGVAGRTSFFDATSGVEQSLPPVVLDPGTQARTADCPTGDFSRTPSCWNFADFRRRVWGLGVRRDPASQEVRLFYAVWSSQGFGNADYPTAGDDQRNALWSVQIGPDGAFDASTVRREFFLPDFFRSPEAIARAGRSHPVSDITFPAYGDQAVMLLAERGGVRNLGLAAEGAFAHSNESRVLRYELDPQGIWQPVGRYDVGFSDREDQMPPYIRAGASGGVSFGIGYGENWEIDAARPDAFVWMTGDGLCSPNGLCFDLNADAHTNSAEVHGVQGSEAESYEEIEPEAAFQPYPAPGPAYPPAGPDRSFMIDADITVDASGNAIEEELSRNDATRIGDLVVFVPPPAAEVAQADEEITEEGFPEGGFPDGVIPEDYYADEPFPEELFPEDFFPDDWDEQFDLAILKSNLTDTCQEGARCAYEITISNNGPDIYFGPLAVSDTMPDGATFESASAGWTCAPSGGTVDCRRNAHVELAAFANETFEIAVTLPVPVIGDEIENCISIDWDAIGRSDGGGDANDTACVTIPVQERFDLGIAKSSEFGDCAAGSECIYQIEVTNHGPGEFSGLLVLTETLPAGATLASSSGAWGCSQTDGEARCARVLPTLGVGDTETLTLRMSFPIDTPDGDIENCVAIAWDEMDATDGDADAHADEDCHTISIHHIGYDLAITKSGPASCDRGGVCSYTVEITNNGPNDFTGVIAFTDVYPSGSSVPVMPAVVWACVPHIEPAFSCESGPLTTIAVGASVTVNVDVHIPDPYIYETVENCASFNFSVMPDDRPHDTNDEDCAFTNVGEGFDLVIEKTSGLECVEGSVCDYEISITNNGPRDFEGPLVVTDTMPDGGIVQTAATGWTCVPTGAPNETTCTSNDDVVVLAGASASLTLGVRLPDEILAGTVENCATLALSDMGFSSDADGTNNGPVCAATNILDADVALFGGTSCERGSACPISVTMRNVGGRAFSGMLAIDGSLDPAVEIKSVAGPDGAWSCSITGSGRYRCGRRTPMRLEKGEEQKLSIVLQIPQDFEADVITHRFWIARPQGVKLDANPHNDANVSYITITGDRAVPAEPEGVDLVVKKTGPASCTAGGICNYTVTVVNAGPGTYRGIVYVFDTYPGYVDSTFLEASPEWDCFDDAGTVECRHDVVELGPRESVTLNISVRIADNIADDMEVRAGGGLRNCAFIGWPGEYMSDERHRNFWVERSLVQEGLLDKDEVDGVLTAADRRAIHDYQIAHGLKPTGRINSDLWNSLFPYTGRLAGDLNADNDRPCISTPLAPTIPPATMSMRRAADLAINKTATQGACMAGENCRFGITITNNGTADYSGRLQIADVIKPASAKLRASSPGAWTCRASEEGYKCTHPATTIAPGQSRSLSLTFATRPDSSGTLRNCANISLVKASRIIAVQTALNDLGFPVGKPDGKVGRRTRKAVRDYQKSIGMRATGRINQALLQKLFGAWGTGDANADNDIDCATVEVQPLEVPPAVAPPPRCEPGWIEVSRKRAKTLVSKGWQVVQVRRSGRSILCARQRGVEPVPPQCTGGRKRNAQGQCVCPPKKPVWNGQICTLRVVPQIQCIDGKVRGKQCICPKGWKRVRKSASVFRCVKPRPQRCVGGKLVAGKCKCPPNTRRTTPAGNTVACKPITRRCPVGTVGKYPNCKPKPRAERCVGGKLVAGRCKCPPNTRRTTPAPNTVACKPIAKRCPRGTIGKYPNCKPKVKLQRCTGGRIRKGARCVCPRGRVWNAKMRKCVRP